MEKINLQNVPASGTVGAASQKTTRAMCNLSTFILPPAVLENA